MWRSQRARESIITYRYELTPDTTWYLSMRLHLLWCDASIPNDICYAISVRFIFPTLTYTSHSLYLHIGGRKDFLFCQGWSMNPVLHTGQACYPWATTPGLLEKFGDFTLHSPVSLPSPNWKLELFLPPASHKDSFSRLQFAGFSRHLSCGSPCGDRRKRNSWLRRHVLPTYMSALGI